MANNAGPESRPSQGEPNTPAARLKADFDALQQANPRTEIPPPEDGNARILAEKAESRPADVAPTSTSEQPSSETPEGLSKSARDRFHELTRRAEAAERKAQSAESAEAEKQQMQSQLDALREANRQLRTELDDAAFSKRMKDFKEPEGFDDWSPVQQQAYVSRQVSRDEVQAQISPEHLARLQEQLVRGDVEDHFTDVNRAQAKAIAKVYLKFHAVDGGFSYAQARRLAEGDSPDLFAKQATSAEEPDEGDAVPMTYPQGQRQAMAKRRTVSASDERDARMQQLIEEQKTRFTGRESRAAELMRLSWEAQQEQTAR